MSMNNGSYISSIRIEYNSEADRYEVVVRKCYSADCGGGAQTFKGEDGGLTIHRALDVAREMVVVTPARNNGEMFRDLRKLFFSSPGMGIVSPEEFYTEDGTTTSAAHNTLPPVPTKDFFDTFPAPAGPAPSAHSDAAVDSFTSGCGSPPVIDLLKADLESKRSRASFVSPSRLAELIAEDEDSLRTEQHGKFRPQNPRLQMAPGAAQLAKFKSHPNYALELPVELL